MLIELTFLDHINEGIFTILLNILTCLSEKTQYSVIMNICLTRRYVKITNKMINNWIIKQMLNAKNKRVYF